MLRWDDGVHAIWDVATGRELRRFEVERTKGTFGWVATGHVDLAIAEDGAVCTALAPGVYAVFDPRGSQRTRRRRQGRLATTTAA